MNHLITVFWAIKKHCIKAGVSNEKCFSELEKLVAGRQVFLSLYLYIEVLQSLGLITFCNDTKKITLTEKGETADNNSLAGLRAAILLSLFFLRRAFLFVLFWPMYLFAQKPYTAEEEKNSAGW